MKISYSTIDYHRICDSKRLTEMTDSTIGENDNILYETIRHVSNALCRELGTWDVLSLYLSCKQIQGAIQRDLDERLSWIVKEKNVVELNHLECSFSVNYDHLASICSAKRAWIMDGSGIGFVPRGVVIVEVQSAYISDLSCPRSMITNSPGDTPPKNHVITKNNDDWSQVRYFSLQFGIMSPTLLGLVRSTKRSLERVSLANFEDAGWHAFTRLYWAQFFAIEPHELGSLELPYAEYLSVGCKSPFYNDSAVFDTEQKSTAKTRFPRLHTLVAVGKNTMAALLPLPDTLRCLTVDFGTAEDWLSLLPRHLERLNIGYSNENFTDTVFSESSLSPGNLNRVFTNRYRPVFWGLSLNILTPTYNLQPSLSVLWLNCKFSSLDVPYWPSCLVELCVSDPVSLFESESIPFSASLRTLSFIGSVDSVMMSANAGAAYPCDVAASFPNLKNLGFWRDCNCFPVSYPRSLERLHIDEPMVCQSRGPKFPGSVRALSLCCLPIVHPSWLREALSELSGDTLEYLDVCELPPWALSALPQELPRCRVLFCSNEQIAYTTSARKPGVPNRVRILVVKADGMHDYVGTDHLSGIASLETVIIGSVQPRSSVRYYCPVAVKPFPEEGYTVRAPRDDKRAFTDRFDALVDRCSLAEALLISSRLHCFTFRKTWVTQAGIRCLPQDFFIEKDHNAQHVHRIRASYHYDAWKQVGSNIRFDLITDRRIEYQYFNRAH